MRAFPRPSRGGSHVRSALLGATMGPEIKSTTPTQPRSAPQPSSIRFGRSRACGPWPASMPSHPACGRVSKAKAITKAGALVHYPLSRWRERGEGGLCGQDDRINGAPEVRRGGGGKSIRNDRMDAGVFSASTGMCCRKTPSPPREPGGQDVRRARARPSRDGCRVRLSFCQLFSWTSKRT